MHCLCAGTGWVFFFSSFFISQTRVAGSDGKTVYNFLKRNCQIISRVAETFYVKLEVDKEVDFLIPPLTTDIYELLATVILTRVCISLWF